MEERDLKKYQGYRIIDDEVKEILDGLRERYPKKFEGYLEAKRRGYRWKLEWGELRRLSLKKENGWLRIPIDVILGKEEMEEGKFIEEGYEK